MCRPESGCLASLTQLPTPSTQSLTPLTRSPTLCFYCHPLFSFLLPIPSLGIYRGPRATFNRQSPYSLIFRSTPLHIVKTHAPQLQGLPPCMQSGVPLSRTSIQCLALHFDPSRLGPGTPRISLSYHGVMNYERPQIPSSYTRCKSLI